MKKPIAILLFGLLSMNLLADMSLWSDYFYLDGSEIKEDEVFLLYPDDELNYSSAQAEGNPKSLSITVKDTDDPEVSATIFTESSDEEIEGVTYWDYEDEEYQGFPTDDTYTLTETVKNDTETKVFKRTIAILPEPLAIFALAVIGAFCLRKRAKSLLALIALAVLCASSAKAESSVTEVTCHQMLPFDRSVVINYTIESDTATSFTVAFYGYDDDREDYFKLTDRGTLSREGANGEVSGVGKHKTLWTPDKSWYDYEDGAYIKVKVLIEEIKPNQVFEYELSEVPGTTLPVYKVNFYGTLTDGKEYLLEEIGTLAGEGKSGIVLGSGKHQITWFPQAALTNMVEIREFRVECEDVTTSAKYLVLNLENNKMRPERLGPMEDPSIWSNNVCRTSELWLRRIEPGTFTMGSPEDEVGRIDSDEVQHEVTLTKAFYIGVFETTQKQYEFVTDDYPSSHEGDERPVENVSYDELRGLFDGAQWPTCGDYRVDKESFFGQLRDRAGNIFDLPTEAQWEYACRAGTTTALNSGKNLTGYDSCPEMDEVGRYWYNGGRDQGDDGYLTHTIVGSYLPNAWGLYDMHGNVCEWCLDWYKSNLGRNSVTDPLGWKSGRYRVRRGGSWCYGAYFCRSANRPSNYPDYYDDDYGFRIVLVQNTAVSDEIRKDFEFENESETGNTLPVYKVKFYGTLTDGNEYLLEDIGRLENDGASGIVVGKDDHHITWFPDAEYTNLAKEVIFRVEYEDVTDQATYLVLDLNSNKMRTERLGPMEDASILSNDLCRTTELWLRRVEPGTFLMGSPKDELGRDSDERLHTVKLTKAYYIGVFEITQKQYEMITDINPSWYYDDETRPVDAVSYDDLRGTDEGATWPKYTDHRVDEDSFFALLRTRAGNLFDLPTEAQWEMACRAGTTNAWNNGTDVTSEEAEEADPELDKLGWYYFNSGDPEFDPDEDDDYWDTCTTHPVGEKLPNAWGLYDMHGNVMEWCLDGEGNYKKKYEVEPVGGADRDSRVIRGGDIFSYSYTCRSANRIFTDSDDDDNWGDGAYGFRVVITSNIVVEDDSDEPITETFSYTVNSETGSTLPVFKVKFYGRLNESTEYLLEDLGKLENDGAAGMVLGNGEHNLIWCPADAYTNLVCKLTFRVEYEDVTEQAKYLVLDLDSNKMRTELLGPMEDASILSNEACRTTELWLRRVEPGTFIMGSPEDELGRNDRETQHQVTISKAFYIGVFETTQSQFETIVGYNPSSFINYACPVECVSYNDLRGVEEGANWPSKRDVDDDSFFGELRTRAGNSFDLPTEAQWEFACRAGTTTSWNDGTSITNIYSDGNLAKLGRYRYNANDGKGDNYYSYCHTTVGCYLPNAWGLYDMHGNVWEWCADWSTYDLGSDPVTDPAGSNSGSMRMFRGGGFAEWGGWGSDARHCRAANRDCLGPRSWFNDMGFRIVLVP